MQVVVLLLLVAGLALLVLGLMTGSTPLVLASIAASLLAAYVMVRVRRRQDGVAGSARASGAAPAKASSVATARASGAVRAKASASAAEKARGAAIAGDTAAPASPAGKPARAYATSEPVGAQPVDAATAPAEAVASPAETSPAETSPAETSPAETSPAGTAPTGPDPAGTVDSDDPATPEPPVADTEPPLRSRGDEPVWVIDGRPRYHLPHCGFLLGRQPEPVPLRQAFEDGFSPCALCDPDTGLATREASAHPAES